MTAPIIIVAVLVALLAGHHAGHAHANYGTAAPTAGAA
jgi:hypothetical protein